MVSNGSSLTQAQYQNFSASLLLVDPSVRIIAANPSSGELWQRKPDTLSGLNFAELFEFDVVSIDPDILTAQWEALVVSGLDRSTELRIRREGEENPKIARVHLAAASGMDGHYFASVELSTESQEPQSGTSDSKPAHDWQLLADMGSLAFFDLQFKAGEIYYSNSFKRILGYVEAELPNTYETWTRLLHPEDSGAAPDLLGKKATSAGAKSFVLEFRMQHRKGHWVWIQSLGLRMVGEDLRLERVIGINLDITERKEVEELGIINDERLHALCGKGPVGAFEVYFPGQRLWLSPSFKTLLGYEVDELPGGPENLLNLLPEEAQVQGLAAWFSGLGLAGTHDINLPIRLRAKTGEWRQLQLVAHFERNRRHEILRATGAILALPAAKADLPSTAQVSAEGLIPPLLIAACFDQIAEAVLLSDSKGRIIFANAPACRLLQREEDSLLTKPLGECFQLVHRETGQVVIDDPCEQAISAEGPLPLSNKYSLVRVPKDQSPLPIVWSGAAVYGEGGRPEGVVIVFRDPEELSLTPEELVKANRFESLAMLAGGIAHDFNNLLTTILGGISLAKEKRDIGSLSDSEDSCIKAKALTKLCPDGLSVHSFLPLPREEEACIVWCPLRIF